MQRVGKNLIFIIMKKETLFYFFIVVLVFSGTNTFSQKKTNFVIIDEIADNISQLRTDFSNKSNVYVTTGFAVKAPMQISNALKNIQVEDLHIYVSTKPGAIVFSSIAIIPENVDEFAKELATWKTKVSNQVVIHSDVVFTGEDGVILKQRLEDITDLIFTMQK